MPWPRKLTVDHLYQMASWSVHSLSKYCVHKFGNRRTDGRTHRQQTQCLCLPVWPGGGIRLSVQNLIEHSIYIMAAVQCNKILIITSSVATRFGRHVMPPTASNPDHGPSDIETGMRVASKVGNLPSKFGHARPLGSRIIDYVRDGRTDRQTGRWTDRRTNKQRFMPPSLWSGTY